MPLLQNIMLGVLGVFVVMVTLSEIGVNIAPLLAGAGVVGIAVGFGAQTLAKDLISGMSVILEDSIAVGDVVQLGDKSGVVEWMSLRSLRLRDGTGTVHWIPFGDVQIVSNTTKDFSYAMFDLSVSYDADADKAMAVMRAVAEGLRADPDIRAVHPRGHRDLGRRPVPRIRGADQGAHQDRAGPAMAGDARIQPPHQARLREGRHRHPLSAARHPTSSTSAATLPKPGEAPAPS